LSFHSQQFFWTLAAVTPWIKPQLGLLLPAIDAIAKALQGRDAVRLQPSGAYAANLLGLSDQVPMKFSF
jgi:Family of unknown function (DUF6088)